jgi:hypothetical protein
LLVLLQLLTTSLCTHLHSSLDSKVFRELTGIGGELSYYINHFVLPYRNFKWYLFRKLSMGPAIRVANGAFYKRHLMSFMMGINRIITTVLYSTRAKYSRWERTIFMLI